MASLALRVSVLSAALCGALSAQDLIGVGWAGQVVRIDSQTAAVTVVGSGTFGQNALARDGRGRLWCTQRTVNTPYVYDLTTIDPNTGAATVQYAGIDLRGLTGGGGSLLYGITLSSGSRLVSIDVSTGTITTIGPTTFSSIQGLAMHGGVLYGWDLSRGLVTIDPATGAGTDPFPTVGGPTGLQYLCSHPDGRLLAGGGSTTNSLYSVDLTNGVATLIGVTSGASDLRGLEAVTGSSTSYGQACNGTFGLATLTVTGTLRAGGQLISTSVNHAAGAPGILAVGLSASNWLGLPLPFSLDPLLGTNGCSLLQSLDVQFSGAAGVGIPADLQFAFPIPNGVGNFTVYLQHACFEPVPGNMSWSNGAVVFVSF
ncbi:MAG: hypothetical protein JNM84_14415 [Planctomycetes bacterium]|nr:hypothetical protein [Planctomycetota bacterium]